MTKFTPFDAADYLEDEETIAQYITAALEDPDPDVFLTAVRDVARARGMAQLAKDTGLGRESLYKALTVGDGDLARIASPEHDKGALEMNIQEAIDLGQARAKVARKNRASVKPPPVEL